MPFDALTNDPPTPISSAADFAHAVGRFIERNPNVLGGADIYLADFGTPAARAGIFMAALAGVIDDQRQRAIQRYVLVAPPGTDAAALMEEAWGAFTEAVETLGGSPIVEQVAARLRASVSVAVLPDRRVTSVIRLLEAQPDRSALIVMEAAGYRDDSVTPFIVKDAIGPLRPEDVWVPQLHALARTATRIVRSKPLHVALDAARLVPTRPELADLLTSIDGCGVMGGTNEGGIDAVLSQHVDRWDAWIRLGHLGRVLREVDGLPPEFDGQKAYLRIQILHRARQYPQALQAIRHELGLGRELDHGSRVKLARIAQDAGARTLARELLFPVVATLTTQEDLESALSTAQAVDAEDLTTRLAERLEALFPESPGIVERRRMAWLADGDYASLAGQSKDPAVAAMYSQLHQGLSGKTVPDYAALIRSAHDNVETAETFRLAAVDDALRRHLLVHAFDLIKRDVRLPAFQSRRDQRLLRVLEELLLHAGRDGTLPVATEDVRTAIISLIRSLAHSPDNQRLRVRLAAIVQPSSAGTMGLALMASAVLSLASAPLQIEQRSLPGTATMEWFADRKAFLRSLFAWLESESPAVLGRLSVPSSLMIESADEFVSATAHYIENAPIAGQDDVQAIQNWLALGTAVAPHSSDPDFDLRLIRLAAGKLASEGFPQIGRDLAEQALLNCTATPRRRRLGWFGMADVYHRTYNHLEALLALGAAFASDGRADHEEAFQEMVGLARILRDTGLHDAARMVLGRARDLLVDMGLADSRGHRIDTLDLQIRQQDPALRDPRSARFQTLLNDAVAVGRTVLSLGDLTGPIASVLAQLLRAAREAGAQCPAEADEVLNDLIGRVGGALAGKLRTMAAPTPSAQDLFGLRIDGDKTRYSEDVGFDTRVGALLAGRSLADDDFLQAPDQVSFALELLTDRGVAVPGWDEIAEPPPEPANIAEPAQLARDLSRSGISIVQVGWDDRGRLVRLEAAGGVLSTPIREPTNLIEEAQFQVWSTTYPYAYGTDETSVNLFYVTTQNLRFSGLPQGPVVLVSDVSFQAFPPNLVRVGDEFASRTQAVAATPSLAWLAAARARGPIGDGRRCAWISSSESSGQTLAMLAQRLDPIFHAHGFQLDTGPRLPASFSGAGIAVITAHGGVHPEGQYFQVVSDEGVLRLSGADLANALRNVGLVILFVCSGGRVDKHPVANTALGLAKQILDRGCSAVVASPWPLDSRVPAYWLPAFMMRWEAGTPLIEANFAANAAVDKAFALDPARGLAMTVFGDPLVRRR